MENEGRAVSHMNAFLTVSERWAIIFTNIQEMNNKI